MKRIVLTNPYAVKTRRLLDASGVWLEIALVAVAVYVIVTATFGWMHWSTWFIALCGFNLGTCFQKRIARR